MLVVLSLGSNRGKMYPGNPSVVAVRMALTEGNGPYSNPLKDEWYTRFKSTETSGRKRQKKKRQGSVGEAPFYASLSPHSERQAPY